jgi:hypothetical protein
MRDFKLVTEADLARARVDASFRQQLLIRSLERLLGELSRLQRAPQDDTSAGQVREGIELAVKLSDLLRRRRSGTPHAA